LNNIIFNCNQLNIYHTAVTSAIHL